MSEDAIVIVGAARTPMGGMLGDLSAVKATDLGATAIAGALKKGGVAGGDIDGAVMGCVLPAGLGQAPARQAAKGAGLANDVPCVTVNKMCGSGMQAIMQCHDAIRAGSHKVMVAGGLESMSNAPYLLAKARAGFRLGHGEVKDHMFLDGLEDAYEPGRLMGAFADEAAAKYQFSREAQDDYAISSVERAQAAIAGGKFEAEVAPVTIKSRKGETVVSIDEQPGKAKIDRIPALRPAFNPEGTVTAANASSISDGAAALVLMCESEALARGLKPEARILGHAVHARAPAEFTSAPVGAMRALFEKTGMSADQIDLYEVNEAFAVVAMIAMAELGLEHDKVNVHGGACALGHPIGASGARIVVTLINALREYDKEYGVASLCIGGGEATAVAVQRLG